MISSWSSTISGTKQWTQHENLYWWGPPSNGLTARRIATDSSGNVYVTGNSFGLTGITSAGGVDLFVIKYDSSGAKQWTRQLGTSSGDYANGIATDSSGNVYVNGDTWGGLDGNTNAGGDDIFVVKYNSTGVKQWTQQLGSSNSDYAQGTSTDSSGNVYLTGYTTSGLDGNTNAESYDLFVVKYDTDGNKQ